MTLGQMLKERRKELDLTQEDVARATKLDRAYISRLEHDDIKEPGAKTIFALAKVYRLDPDTLFVAAGLLEPPPTLEQAQAIAKSELVLLAEQANRQLTDAEKDRIAAFILFTMQDSHEKRRYRLEHPKDSEAPNDHPPH